MFIFKNLDHKLFHRSLRSHAADLLVAGALCLFVSTAAQATEGINLVGVGPVQQGTAGAGVASPKSSSWIVENPAGIVIAAPGLDVSLEIFAPVRTLSSTVSGGAGTQRDRNPFYIPAISYSAPVLDGRGTWGIGIYGSSGMGVDYKYGRIGTPGRQTMFDQRTELQVIKAIPAYAHRFGDGWSVGAGAVFVMSRLRTDMINAMGIPSSDRWDDAYGAGVILGLVKRIDERWSVGTSYMSEQPISNFDKYKALLGGSLDLPQQLTAGVAFKATDDVELALDYRWLGWGELDTFGDTFGWNNQHIAKVGLTWDASERLTLRSGFSHGNSPIKSRNAFSNALFPAIMRTHASLGLSYAFDRFTLDLAYVHAFCEKVTANGADAGGMGAGTRLSMYQNSLTVGARLAF